MNMAQPTSAQGLDDRLAKFRARLTELVDTSGGPGVSFAVGHAGEVFTAAAGIANLNTGQPVTPETKFLIGSNTKSMTIALMCRAADDGLVDLDARVLDYLPTFRTADEATTQGVTIRHLLLHTSGIGGDFFRDFGRGDDAIARLVDALPEAGVAHPVGMCWAYSNAAYVVVGRILEVVHGKPYAQILRERLLEPLGMTETALTPEESILGATAVGHVALPDGKIGVTPEYLLPHAMAPAGSIANATARDMVKFGRMLLEGGRTASGEQLLAPATVDEMFRPAIRIPRPLMNHYMCLSMLFEETPVRRRYLSSGGTTGQLSFFFLLPDDDIILVGLGNGPQSATVQTTIFDEVTRELTGIDAPPKPQVPARPEGIDLSPYVGEYESTGVKYTVEAHDGDLRLIATSKVLAQGRSEAVFQPIGDHQFVAPGGSPGCTFLEVDGGCAEYLWMHSVARRIPARESVH